MTLMVTVHRTLDLSLSVGKFTLYFPYILLIAALVLTGIERFFNKIFKSNIQVPIPCILT